MKFDKCLGTSASVPRPCYAGVLKREGRIVKIGMNRFNVTIKPTNSRKLSETGSTSMENVMGFVKFRIMSKIIALYYF